VSVDFAAAEQFMLREARLLERRLFAWRFRGGLSGWVTGALEEYANDDGGYGNALEPDLRGPSSQPVPLERALEIHDEVHFFARIAGRACKWLASVSNADGGVPFVLPSVQEGPHAPWWESDGVSDVNPTAGIAGLLHKRGFRRDPWVERATEYCFTALGELDHVGPDDAISVLIFLEHVPDRQRADEVFERLGERILNELVALDPATEGYVKAPLEFAPHPDRLARRLFDDATIEAHLDALEATQQEDGGWPITWEPPSAAAVSEWRGVWTYKALSVLDAYGRQVRA
jgi:hypothetical protein